MSTTQQPPSQTDIAILTQIIQSANQRYLHQSRIHKNSSFNILRILSAYKQISEKYSARKDNIYNWIIFITRNYNPQKYNQWVLAVKGLASSGMYGRSGNGSGYGYINNSLSTSNINIYNNPNNSNNISRSQSVQAHHHQINRKTSSKQYSQKNIAYSTNQNNYSTATNNNQYPKHKPSGHQQFGNTYSLQDYQQSIYNKHLADHNNEASQCYHYSYSNNYSNNNQSQTNYNYNYNKSRQMLNYTDDQFKLIPPVSSKLHHYISFQPDSQNKQNINSANMHDQNKSDNMNQPTRTPGQQSFIHNLPLSYGSPFILSKITNNTKEVTEVEVQQDQEENTVEWVNMKARADIFYGINLKFKVFSAILANFQAFESFQEVLKKTRKFRKKLCFSRFYRAATLLLQHRRQKQKQLSLAQNHYQSNLLKKSFKILFIFYQLKIKTQKPILIQKFNPINFQFLISLIFSLNHPEEYEPMRTIHDTPKSIRQKSRYFQNIEDSQKMGIISEYFLCNLKLSKEQIHELFEMHRKARKEKVWGILKNNVRFFKKQQELLTITRKKIAMRYLIRYNKITVRNNVRITIAQTSRQRTLKQKSFNALCQFLMSKKIYMKRQEFLKNNHKTLVMKNIVKEWRIRTSEVQVKKMGRNACVQRGTSILTRTILSKYMKFMVDQHEQRKIRQAEEIKLSNKLLCKSIFQFLKERTKQRKLHLAIKTSKNTKIQKNILVNWLKLTKMCISLRKISIIFTKQIFKTIKKQTQLMQKQHKLSTYLRQQKQRTMLKQLRISFNLDKTQIQSKISKTWKTIQKEQFSIFVKIAKNNLKQAFKNKKERQLQAKLQSAKSTLQKHRKYLVLSQLRQNRMSIMSYNKKQEIIKSVMGNRVIKLNDEQQGGEQIMQQTYTRCHIKMKKEVFLMLNENRDYKQNCIRLSVRIEQKSHESIAYQLRKWRRTTQLNSLSEKLLTNKAQKIYKNSIKILKDLYQASKTKTNKSIAHYNKSLKFKTLLSFAKSIIYSSNLLAMLKNKIVENRKSKSGKVFISQLSKKYQLRIKNQKISKLLFIKQLSKNIYSTQDIEQKTSKLIRMLKKNHIKRLPFSRLLTLQHKISTEFLDQAYKKFAIMKVNQALFRHILSQKQLYMAIKFKALHLCRLSFKSLMLNKQQNNPQLSRSKKFKIHEHISTSYSSL